MFLAYVDESGNIGSPGSRTYTLGCVFMPAGQWPDVFDQMIDYRRFLFRQYGIPVRAEIKANYLIYNKGTFRRLRLSEAARHSVYRGLMRLQPKLDLQTFAVVIHKQRLD